MTDPNDRRQAERGFDKWVSEMVTPQNPRPAPQAQDIRLWYRNKHSRECFVAGWKAGADDGSPGRRKAERRDLETRAEILKCFSCRKSIILIKGYGETSFAGFCPDEQMWGPPEKTREKVIEEWNKEWKRLTTPFVEV